MYEIFEKLLKQNNLTAYKVAKDTGISPSTFSDWKSGRSSPKNEKLQKLAEYFNVSVDYLLKGEKKEPAPSADQDPAAEFGKMLFASTGDIAPEDYTQDDIDDIVMLMKYVKKKKNKE